MLIQELEKDDVVPDVLPKKKIDEIFDMESLPGITNDIARQLRAKDIDTPEDILSLGVDGLKEIKGVGTQRADIIFSSVQKRLKDD
jgi:ERCC4-type nuclease